MTQLTFRSKMRPRSTQAFETLPSALQDRLVDYVCTKFDHRCLAAMTLQECPLADIKDIISEIDNASPAAANAN